jgi:hypothetical protein
MRQRFFFDGINVNGVGIPVSQRIQTAAFILADKTKSCLPFTDLAITGAKIAQHFAIVELVVKLGFHHRRLLQAFQAVENKQPYHKKQVGIARADTASPRIVRMIFPGVGQKVFAFLQNSIIYKKPL